jgi:inner membrane protein
MGHRGLSHSLLAAALIAGLAAIALRPRAGERRTWRWLGLWLVLALAAASHGALDALTNGGRGVAFFAPFSEARHHFPVRPIEVSPIGVREFFTARGLEVIENELRWLWLPSAAALAIAWGLRRLSDPRTPAARGPAR